MQNPVEVPQIKVWQRLPALRTMGFAVEYFPNYVNTSIHPHSVDVVLMTVIVRGRGRHVMGDKTILECSGSVGITHYGQRHDVLTTRRGMDIYNVYLDLQNHPLPVLPKEFHEVLPAILPLHPSFQNDLNRSVHFHISDPKRLSEPLARIQLEMNEKKIGFEEIVQSCFKVFLIECCRAAVRNGWTLMAPRQSVFPKWVEGLRLRLDRDYSESLTLVALAGEARVSIGHLCRIFRLYSGKTVFQYLIERRIQAAMVRLRNSREKILVITLQCGFNDLAYFNRTFRKIVNQTPSQYRCRNK